MMRRDKSRAGFTLVEIIVVLVILAILAAFTIPAMMGFVAESREAEAKQNLGLTARVTQTVLIEMKGIGQLPESEKIIKYPAGTSLEPWDTIFERKLKEKIEGESFFDHIQSIWCVGINKVTIQYKMKNGKTMIYSTYNGPATFTVTEKPTPKP